MEPHTLLLFTATVLPLICTPGPDMLFVVSQTISAGTNAGLRSTAGVCLGYMVHSILAVFGMAAVIAASPMLFETLRWVGVGYLIYLAFQLIRAAMKKGTVNPDQRPVQGQIGRGFLTAVLNPKGMLIYLAVLPQFMRHGDNAALEASLLSATFVFWCAAVYTLISLILGKTGRKAGFSDPRRRLLEASAGGLLAVAAGFIAAR